MVNVYSNQIFIIYNKMMKYNSKNYNVITDAAS